MLMILNLWVSFLFNFGHCITLTGLISRSHLNVIVCIRVLQPVHILDLSKKSTWNALSSLWGNWETVLHWIQTQIHYSAVKLKFLEITSAILFALSTKSQVKWRRWTKQINWASREVQSKARYDSMSVFSPDLASSRYFTKMSDCSFQKVENLSLNQVSNFRCVQGWKSQMWVWGWEVSAGGTQIWMSLVHRERTGTWQSDYFN